MPSFRIASGFQAKPESEHLLPKNKIPQLDARFHGADGRIRTGDLILTKDALYLLSYISTYMINTNGIIHQPPENCNMECVI